MKYMNKRTGAIIEVASVINGEHWEKVEENKEEVKTQEPEEETTVEVDEETSEEPEEEVKGLIAKAMKDFAASLMATEE